MIVIKVAAFVRRGKAEELRVQRTERNTANWIYEYNKQDAGRIKAIPQRFSGDSGMVELTKAQSYQVREARRQ